MTALDHARQTKPAASRTAFAVRTVSAVSNFLRAWKNRRAFYRLGEMSDSELADIGLTRSDLNVAIDLPFGTDPTAHLGAVSQARINRSEGRVRRAV